MDFQKTKIYLDKLNREFARLSKDPENTVRLDEDILASYVRELYDAILSESKAYVSTKAASAPTPQRPVVVEPAVELAPAPPPPPVIAAVPPPAPPPPVREEPPAPAPPPRVAPPAPAPPPPAHPTRTATPAPVGMEALFEEKQAVELSEKLAESAINDLKKAIALNDRLLFTSELFAGDGQAFERVLASLNSMGSFDEARAYMVEYCVTYYTWTDKKRLDTAKSFVKLVRRRYK